MQQDEPTDSPQIRLLQAKQWLAKNPTESQAVAARLFKINRSSLVASIRRDKHSKGPHGGQNKILTPTQEQVIHTFIRLYLENRQLPTKDIIFGAICHLRKAHELTLPSFNWFNKWWRQQPGLHTIKTKPIAKVRVTAQDKDDVLEWFCKYKIALKQYDIQKQNLYNFDETGFRIGCPKGVEVLIPIEVQELYSLSPENRRSITIIETIAANGTTPIPPVIIVQGKYHMESWYGPGGLTSNELVLLSENGYTSDVLGVRFMKHFIEHTQAGPDQSWKLLLMDNHNSHMTAEFVELARANRVVPFPFPSHLTHCMQPLDVGIFQPYKHWHNKAIQSATESLDFEYSLNSFFGDLYTIREKTFSKSTVQHAWRKAGMWPVKRTPVFKLMAKYIKKERKEKPPDLPKPGTPETIRQVQYQLGELGPKVIDLLSSPSQRKFDSFQRGVQRILDEGHLATVERDLAYQRIEQFISRKPSNKKRLQRGGELTTEYAQNLKQEKERKAAEKEAKKEARMLRQIVNKEKKEHKAAWVAWRKKESLRKKAIKQLPRGVMGVPELYKAHTPPPFIEPGKEPVDQKPSIATINSTENLFQRPPQTPVQQLIRTSFAKSESYQEQEQEQQLRQEIEESDEEDFIRLDFEGEFGYSNTSSESEDSLNSSVSDEEDYYIL
jgi:hypothetical protein